MNKKTELLAPAGTLSALKTAVLYGADAVYMGLPGYCMRARAKMSVADAIEGVKFAHERNVKVYLAFNIFAHDFDFDSIDTAKKIITEIGPDAIIVADPGIMTWVRENFPNMPIHISTQANITNSAAVKFWQASGASLCVLARELSAREIKKIRAENPDVQLEIFIHGAMCISYSGRCLMSSYMTNRDANRGACAQPCRFGYELKLRDVESGHEIELQEDARGAYIMNSRDMCMMPVLSEVIATGVDSLKIEGRMKSEYYVGSVVRAYRNAIDSYFQFLSSRGRAAGPRCLANLPIDLGSAARPRNDNEDFNFSPFMDDLNILESRGYTVGFWDGRPDNSAQNYETRDSVSEHCAAGVVTEVHADHIIMELRNEIKDGDEITFLLPGTEKINIKCQISNIKLKESAGQGNAIKIPMVDTSKFVPLILAYRKK